MTKDEIRIAAERVFRDVFEDEDIVITEKTTANDIAEWDSLHHINLIFAMEAEFGIKFRTSEVERLTHVGDLLASIEGKFR